MYKFRDLCFLFSTIAMMLVLSISTVNAGFPCHRDCYNHNSSRWHSKPPMPPYDRPFPLGQVSDAFWEIQQTNAEAADFIMFDYEFVGDTAVLNPLGREHMTQIARRLPHVPFPIVIEMSEKTNDVKENQELITIDEKRRANVVMWLQKFYADDPTMDPELIERRVVIAPDFSMKGSTAGAYSDVLRSRATHSTGHRR